jgi:hypothetical protein
VTKVKIAWKKSFGTPDYKKAAKGLIDTQKVAVEITETFSNVYEYQKNPDNEARLQTFLTEGSVLRNTMYDAITEQLLSALKADPNANLLKTIRTIENNPDIKRLQSEGETLKNNLSTPPQLQNLADTYLCIDVEAQVKAILTKVDPRLLEKMNRNLNDKAVITENLQKIEKCRLNAYIG